MTRLGDMNPFQRHKRLIAELDRFYGLKAQPQLDTPVPRGDSDIVRETFRFIRREGEDYEANNWEINLARAYYSKLFREYALVDLSRYKTRYTALQTGEFGCRWRTKEEVVAGKGQFKCGCLDCAVESGLESYEVPFTYVEEQTSKHALVKVRLCQKHAFQLNHRKVVENKKNFRRAQKASKRDTEVSGSERPKKRRRHASPPVSPADATQCKPRNVGQRKVEAVDSLHREVDDFLSQLFP